MPTALTPAQIRRVAEQIAAARDTMRGGSMSANDKNTHTPGPWILAGRFGYGWLISPNIAVAYGGEGSGHSKDGEANARLIAAAPEMLEALRMALPYIVKVACTSPTEPARIARQRRATEDVAAICTIINKAEGAA